MLNVLVLFVLGAAPAAAQQPPDFGTLLIQVRPAGAEILIDGVQWPASETAEPLKLQLAPGSHKVEIRAPGRQTFAQTVTIRAGETLPLNVSLTASERPVVSPPPPPAPTPRPRVNPPPPPQQPAPSGPSNIQVGPSDDGFMIAPDVRFTEVNGHATTLVGAYGGMVFGRQLLVGAGVYFQVYDYYNTYVNYFGPVVEYRLFPDKRIGLNLHALIGGGVAYGGNNCCYPNAGPYHYGYYYYPYNQGFFVFEPEAQVSVRFSPVVSLKGAIGYRVTSGYNLDGVSGSISLQIGK